MSDIKTKIIGLREQLHRHNRLYHTEGKTEITDAQFDTLLRELEKLESEHPEFSDPNSPTARVGGKPFPGFPEFKHRVKMLSLDKVFTLPDLAKWCATHGADVAVEPKIDGLSLSLHYVRGALDRAVTRGDGAVGAECTANARAISTVPLMLPCLAFTGEVRGEVYMSKASFAENNRRLLELGEDEFANPRNAAAGTFKSLDPGVVAERKLSFVAYDVTPKETDWEGTQVFLKANGFVTTGDLLTRAKLTGMTVSGEGHAVSLSQLLTKWEKGLDKLEVETDGAVIKVCSHRIAQELGAGTKTVKWAVAYKFPPKQVKTKLLDIVLSVGRTGIVVPNAVLEPVWIDGTWVSAASLCNQDEVDRLGVRPGDNVWVHKSGEIVPKILGIAP